MRTLIPPTEEPPVAPPDDGPNPAAPPPDDPTLLAPRKRRLIAGTALLAAAAVVLTYGVAPWHESLLLTIAWVALAVWAGVGMTQLDWDPWKMVDDAASGYILLALYAGFTAFSARGWLTLFTGF